MHVEIEPTEKVVLFHIQYKASVLSFSICKTKLRLQVQPKIMAKQASYSGSNRLPAIHLYMYVSCNNDCSSVFLFLLT